MIRSKEELKEYLACERELYFEKIGWRFFVQGFSVPKCFGSGSFFGRFAMRNIIKTAADCGIMLPLSGITAESIRWESAWVLRSRKIVLGRG